MKTFLSLLFAAYALRVLYNLLWSFKGLRTYQLIVEGQFKSTELDNFPIYEVGQEEYAFVLDKINSFYEDAANDVECSLLLDANEINCLACDGVTPIKPFGLAKESGLLFFYFEDGKLFRKRMFCGGPVDVTSELAQIKIVEIPINQSRSENPNFPYCRIGIHKDFVRQKKNDAPSAFDQWIGKRSSKIPPQIVKYLYDSIVRDFIKANSSFSEKDVRSILIHKITSLEISSSRLALHANKK
jgi:hypothetical protein